MRLLKLSLIGLLISSSSLVISGCGGTLAGTNTAFGTLAVSTSTVDFGQVAVGKTVSISVTVSNKGTAAVEISQLNLTGQSFSLGAGSSLPVTVGGNASVTLSIQFDPGASGPASGQLTITSNAAIDSSASVALSGVGVPVLTGLTCVNGSITGAAADSCSITLNAAAGSNGLPVNLTSNSSAIVVPATVTIPAGANSADFTANASPVTSPQAANLTASVGGVAETFAVQLDAALQILGISTSSVAFGSVPVNSPVSQPVVLSSTGTVPVTVSAASLSGTGFSISGASLPVTLAPGQTIAISVQFDPAASGVATGQLSLASNSSSGSSMAVALSGTGVPVLNGVTCVNLSITGSLADSCSVTLNAAAPSGGFPVSLASSNPLVNVPGTVIVAAGASSANFIANASPVNSPQPATLTASAGGTTDAITLQLGSSISTLNLSANSINFGDVAVSNAETQTLTLSSTGSAAVTIDSSSLLGTGFTASGANFPLTLNPNQTATLTLQFDPSATGSLTGELDLTSNASGSRWRVGLLGRGVPRLTIVTCASGSITGAGTDSCTVALNSAAPAGGLTVNLTSSNASVTVPAATSITAGSTSASFTATVSAVNTAQSATLDASAGGVSQATALTLNAASITLGVSATSIGFGSVNVNSPASQTLTLSSTGSSAVTVSAATVAGAGFTVSGATFPMTINPNSTATLTVQFDPTAAGADTGSLTLTSNSTSGTSTLISLTGTGVPILSGLSCSKGSITGVGTDSCTVTLNAAAVGGGVLVSLASNNSAVIVPPSLTVATGATTASFSAAVGSVSTDQAVTLTASANSVSKTFALELGSGVPTLSVSATSIGFGNVNIDTPTTQTLTLSSTGTVAVIVSDAAVAGSGFTISGATFPLTLSPNATLILTVQFDPTTAGTDAGSLTLTSNSSSGTSTVVSLGGSGTPALSGLSCSSASMTGSGTDSCTVTLNVAAASGGFTVSLASNNSAVTLPASVTVAPGATTASFTANVSSVSTAQTVTLTASTGSVAKTFVLQLGSGVPTLSVSAGSIGFGTVNVNTASTQTVTLSSTGTVAVTISAATVAGSGFTVLGATFPLTLNPNSTATLTVQFDPTAAGADTGSLTLTSNSSSGTSIVVSLSGSGTPALSGLSCSSASTTSAGTDSCAVALNVAAASGGFTVSLASNNSAVTVPAAVTVASGATTASFTATISSVSTAQTVTLTASANGLASTFALQLGSALPTLSVNSTSIGFGNVVLSTPATQSVTLSSTGGAALTVNSVTASGAGFTVSGATFPLTMNPSQTVTLSVQFDPTVTGSATGMLAINSNSSTGSSTLVSLSGTGTAVPYQANLTWNAPSNSTDPVVGYNVYRTLSGSTSYQQLNATTITGTTYVDTSVQDGQTYDYIVESVDASDVTSTPSNMASVVVP
jgi:centrosomal CEP192-like protein/ASPM-SPD-2-Hydin domain-containing protein